MAERKSRKRQENSDALRLAMAEALVELMRQNPAAKITASEITERAGVGRVTWFRLFHTKEEALSWLIVQKWNAHLTRKGYSSEKRPSDQENGILFFHFNYENRELIELIFRQGMKYTIYEACLHILLPEPADDVMTNYIANTAAYAFVGILDEWIRRDFQETPEQLISILVAARGTEQP